MTTPKQDKDKLIPQWMPLADLRAGAIFETQEGRRGLKTPDVSANGVWAHCVSLKSGKMFFPEMTSLVREIIIKEGE